MAFLSATTSVGIAAAETALSNGVQIVFSDATFSSDMLAQNPTVLQAVTSLANITYTAPQAQLSYRALPDGQTAMVRISLPTSAAFNFGSYSLNLADGTPFIVGTWDANQVKSAGSLRFIEQRFVLSSLLPTINLTVLTNIDAAIPEVTHETDLPAAGVAPYPLYLVDQHSAYSNHPALASPVAGAWNYFPAAFTRVAAGTYNTLTVNIQGFITAVSNTGYVLKAGDAMTGNLGFAPNLNIFVDRLFFASDPDTGMYWGGVQGLINFFTNGALAGQISSDKNLLIENRIRAVTGAKGSGDNLTATILGDFTAVNIGVGWRFTLPNKVKILVWSDGIQGGTSNEVRNFPEAFTSFCAGMLIQVGDVLASGSNAIIGGQTISAAQYRITNLGVFNGVAYGITLIAIGQDA